MNKRKDHHEVKEKGLMRLDQLSILANPKEPSPLIKIVSLIIILNGSFL